MFHVKQKSQAFAWLWVRPDVSGLAQHRNIRDTQEEIT